jgi:hypothetical protein
MLVSNWRTFSVTAKFGLLNMGVCSVFISKAVNSECAVAVNVAGNCIVL